MWEGHLWKVFAGTESLNSVVATVRCKVQSLYSPLELCLCCIAVIPQSKRGGWKGKYGCPVLNSSYVWVQSVYTLMFLKALDLPKHVPNQHLQ